MELVCKQENYLWRTDGCNPSFTLSLSISLSLSLSLLSSLSSFFSFCPSLSTLALQRPPITPNWLTILGKTRWSGYFFDNAQDVANWFQKGKYFYSLHFLEPASKLSKICLVLVKTLLKITPWTNLPFSFLLFFKVSDYLVLGNFFVVLAYRLPVLDGFE